MDICIITLVNVEICVDLVLFIEEVGCRCLERQGEKKVNIYIFLVVLRIFSIWIFICLVD